MRLTGEEKNKIREYGATKCYAKGKSELMKLINNPKIDRFSDKFFINYSLAWFNYYGNDTKDDLSISRFYLKETKDLFKGVENKESDYNLYQWLYLEVNKNIITKEEKMEILTEIYQYYKKIGHKYREIGTLSSIFLLQREMSLMKASLTEFNHLEGYIVKY